MTLSTYPVQTHIIVQMETNSCKHLNCSLILCSKATKYWYRLYSCTGDRQTYNMAPLLPLSSSHIFHILLSRNHYNDRCHHYHNITITITDIIITKLYSSPSRSSSWSYSSRLMMKMTLGLNPSKKKCVGPRYCDRSWLFIHQFAARRWIFQLPAWEGEVGSRRFAAALRLSGFRAALKQNVSTKKAKGAIVSLGEF